MKLIKREADKIPDPEICSSIKEVSFDEMWHFVEQKKTRVLTIDRKVVKYSSNPLFSFTYQQILSVAKTISADFETTFVRLVNRPKK